MENGGGVLKEIKGYFSKNKYVKLFSILALITLLLFIAGISKVDLGIKLLSQIANFFPAGILFLLLLSFIISAVLAYFEKYNLMVLPVFIWLLIFTVQVRTANIPSLIDVTTGNYTLAPDLDPFLYLRLAQDINSGTLENPDMMRYVPLGAKNYAFQSLMPWAIVYFYKIASVFKDISLTYAAILIPVIFFAISLIGFFLFVKTAFSFKFSKTKAWLIALIAGIFYAFSPQMLHRTVAGVPEIESLGMAFFWFAFLFFMMAWKEQKSKRMIIYGILAGIFTGLMSWSWGGYRYLYMIIGLTTLLIFLFQKDRIKNRKIYFSWIIPALLIILLQVKSIKSLITNIPDTGFGIFVLFLLLADFILFDTKLKDKIKLEKINLPRPLTSLLIGVLVLFLALLVLDFHFVINTLKDVFERLVHPFGKARVGLTVAENKAPYLTEAIHNFSYIFWGFLVSAVLLFYESVKHFSRKNKIILNLAFIIFLCCLAFTRISPTSLLNGENFFSQLVYFAGFVIFILAALSIYIKANRKKDEKTLQDFKEIDFSYILLLAFGFWAIVSMRGAIRLFFIVSPMIIIIASSLPVKLAELIKKSKDEFLKTITIIVLIVTIIGLCFAFLQYSSSTITEAKQTAPGIYEQQWQKAMEWVRDNTSPDSVFVHWWDYGYWVQTLGERSTVADGGHFIGYWPHLIGRYVLTTPNPETALSFMKTHGVSYLLIDSTDLGKYGAYSSIGSDETGEDRLSQIPIMLLDASQSRETNKSEVRVYLGGVYVDEDIIYGENENQIFLPANNAVIAGVILEVLTNENMISQPQGVFYYNNKQIIIPIRYLYTNNNLVDFGGGLDAVVRTIPRIYQEEQGIKIDSIGASIYLSPKVSKGLFAQLYLLNDLLKKYKTITLAYSQPDTILDDFNNQGANVGEFAYFNGFRGPIKIWKVEYPDNILEREEFLRTTGEYAEFDNLTFTK